MPPSGASAGLLGDLLSVAPFYGDIEEIHLIIFELFFLAHLQTLLSSDYLSGNSSSTFLFLPSSLSLSLSPNELLFSEVDLTF